MAAGVRVVWMPGGVRTEIHLGGADTGGAFCLLVDEPPAAWSLPPHRHANEAETMHVLEGEFEVELDGVGMERFFLEVGAATEERPHDLAAALASAQRHGWEFVNAGR